MNRSGVGEVQIDHILYAVLQLTAHTEVKSNASSIFIIFDIADESQVAIGYLGSVFGLHDPVIDPEYLDTDFDFFLGGTERVNHFADRFVELFRRGRAIRAERRQDLHPVNPTFLDLPAVAGNNSFSGFRLIVACHENEILAVVQLGVAFVNEFGVVGDQAVLGLTENLIQHRHGDKAAVNQFAEHIPGAYTGKLIRVSDKNDPCSTFDA